MIDPQKEAELRGLVREDGTLHTEDIVSFAQDPKTALHEEFNWNDTAAAHHYRLWQARQLIVRVRFSPQEDKEPMQAFVSLRNDRGRGGGYRAVADVMSDAERRAELLAQAIADLEVFRRKYARLAELAEVFEAASKVKKPKRARRKKEPAGV